VHLTQIKKDLVQNNKKKKSFRFLIFAASYNLAEERKTGREKNSVKFIHKILIQRSRYNGHIHTDIQRRATLAG